MSKLNDIEAQLKFSEEDGDVAAEWTWDYGELLVRAVRQLGTACEDIQYAGGNYKKMVDPDVLELIGGAG